MKTSIIIATIFALLCNTKSVIGQNLTQIFPESLPSVVSEILIEYYGECVRERYFFEDKGIVEVVVYEDSLSKNRLHLTALIDDRYLDNPPNQYLKIQDRVFLFYKGDQSGKKIVASVSGNLVTQLKNVVEDRVYVRPVKVERTVEIKGVDGNIKKTKVMQITFGNGWNSTTIIFEDKERYSKLKQL